MHLNYKQKDIIFRGVKVLFSYFEQLPLNIKQKFEF